jgi:ubiquinone/menaquinone biosynthesis C-methylase UbiE
MQHFLKIFFSLLYNQFAWAYDIVSAIVSMNQWKDWVLSVIHYIPTNSNGTILELGYGPAHLMVALMQKGFRVFGIDSSENMAILAKKRLLKANLNPLLCKGIAQRLPFASGSFDYVVATFPTRFIYDEGTLNEVRRVLNTNGQLIIALQALFLGLNWLDKIATWLFNITKQASPWNPNMLEPFHRAGFKVKVFHHVLERSTVTIILAQ